MSTQPQSPRSQYAGRLREFAGFAFADLSTTAHRGRWRDYFGERIGDSFDSRVIFEIGCADAAFLSAIAAKFPATAFVGLDWKFKAVFDAAGRIASNELRNVALIRGRAQDLRTFFDAGEVDEIWIFHPEPCDRAVEIKNRLINESFLIDAHSILRSGGSRVCIKTDHAGYFESMTNVCSQRAIDDRFAVTRQSMDFWNDPPAQQHTAGRLFADEATLFERRFIRRHKPIYYLELERQR